MPDEEPGDADVSFAESGGEVADVLLDGEGPGSGEGHGPADVAVADGLAHRSSGVADTPHWYPHTVVKFQPENDDPNRICWLVSPVMWEMLKPDDDDPGPPTPNVRPVVSTFQ